MASSDKLWFELGVRDEASKIINQIISKAEVLDQVFDEISKKKVGSRELLSGIVGEAFDKATEKATKLQAVIAALSNEMKRFEGSHTVNLEMNDNVKPVLDTIEARILELTPKLKELGISINEAMSIQSKDPNQGNLAVIEQLTTEYKSLEEQVNALYDTYEKLSNRQKAPTSKRETAKEAASVFLQDMANEQKVEEQLRMDRHRRAMEQKRDEAEVAAAVREVNKVLSENRERQRLAMEAARERANVNKSLIDSYDKIVASTQKTGNILGQLESQMASYFSLWGAEKLLKNVITIGGEFEVQHLALQNILGDVQQANSMFEQMKELAVESPFNFRQLATYGKQIAAFGVPYEEMYDTTKRLADLSAGLGVDMSRLILAYGQVRSAAVLRGQELRQFTEAGIPMVKALAEEFTRLNGKATSTADVFELISKRAVPFEMVKKVLWDMTSEGGRFYDMQFVLADTLTGKWSNLRDAWEIMLSNIAKGESLSGRMLKTIVQGLTDLITSMHTLTPLLAGIGGFFALRGGLSKLNNMWDFGTGNIEANVKKAQDLHAIELKRRRLNMEISEEQFKQGMQINRNKQNFYMQLAMEGRLKEIQIARAVQQGKINVKKIEERLLAGEITQREAAQLRLWRMKYAQAKMFNVAVKSLGASINAMMGPIGWISLAIDVMLTTILTISSKVAEVNAKNKELADGFANRAKELQDSINSLQAASPTNDEEYKSNVEALKEILKQHSANYDAIILEANGLKTLQEQYEFLKSQLKETEKVYKDAEAGAPDFADATRKSFENAKESARDYFKALKEGKISMGGGAYSDIASRGVERNLREVAKQVREELPNIGTDAHSNAVFRQMRDALLQELGVGSRESMMIKIRLNELLNITNAEDAAGLVVDEFSDMIAIAAPEVANKIKYGRELEKAEQEKVHDLIRDASNNVGKEYPYLANYLQKLLNDSNFFATIQLRFSTDKASANAVEGLVYGRFASVTDEDVKTTATNWVRNAGGNLYEARNRAKQDIDASKNKKIATHQVMDAIIKDSKSSQKDIDAAKLANKQADDEYRKVVTAALTGLNFDYEGENKKSNKAPKTPKGSQKDTILEAAKTRLEEIKDFYAEYKKFRELYGEEKGLSMVEDIFGMEHGKAERIVSDYKTVLEEILESVPQDTEARKKFAIGLKKLLADIDIDATKNELQKSLREIERYIQDETSKWNLYKNLLDKTGSKEFAMKAFVDDVVWDDVSRKMAERLKEGMSKRKLSFAEDIFKMDQDEAEKFFGKDTAELRLWEEIVKSIRKNWTDGLNDIAEATSKLMTTEDKIVKAERELAELRGKYGKDDPRVIAKERELDQLQAEAFEQSEPYLKFYSAIFSMTIDEAEKMGVAIKKNLVDQLSKGGLNADKFLKSIKNVDQQLEKIRSRKSFFETFSSGGFSAVAEQNYEDAFGAFSVAAQRVADAEEKRDAARIKAAQAITEEEKKAAKYALIRAEVEKTVSEQQLKEAKARLDGAITQVNLSAKFTRILGEISSVLDVMTDAYDSWREMAEAVDGDVEIDAWAEDMFSIFSSASKGIQKLQSGDIFGALTSTVFGPITALSKNHDARLQKKIENSQRMVRALTNEYQDLQDAMERALGGIYTTGGYDEMYDNLKKQRDEIQKQQDLEYEKKNTDKDKIADYDQQLKELDETMKNYALDMAKALYDIDLHSWASELTDAIVGAWEKGDDAAEAYREKVKDIMKDLTKNILAKKVMEKAFANLGIDEIIANMMDASSGRLDETAIPRLAEALGQAGNLTVDAITKTLDAMEANGTIEREASSSKSSTSNTIKGITENTADLLASYINAIRADVSVNRMTLTEILSAVQGQSELPVIAQAQLLQLEQISSNTLRNALAAEMIYDILHSNVLGNEKFNVK